MDLPSSLIGQLDSILHPLVPDADSLSASASGLVASLSAAVASFRGLHLSLNYAGHPVTLTVFDEAPAGSFATSLRWRLNGAHHTEPDQLILYAAQPGAFVDLAADLRYAMASRRSDAALDADLRLDQDLPPATITTALTGLSELSLLNRAAGVLIEGGADPHDALADLDRRALVAGLDRYAYAQRLLTSPDKPGAGPA